jgi:hypothetical protein
MKKSDYQVLGIVVLIIVSALIFLPTKEPGDVQTDHPAPPTPPPCCEQYDSLKIQNDSLREELQELAIKHDVLIKINHQLNLDMTDMQIEMESLN